MADSINFLLLLLLFWPLYKLERQFHGVGAFGSAIDLFVQRVFPPASGNFFWFLLHFSKGICCVFLSFTISQDVLAAITKPTLSSPSDNVTITESSKTFSWSHPYKDQYELKIKNQSGDFVYVSGKTSSYSKKVDLSGIPLTYGNTYKWYVVVYANGLEDSSADRYFTYKSDSKDPIVGSFTVDTTSVKLGEKFTFNYSLSDSGGSNLQKAELWRSTDGDHFSPVSGKVNSHSGTSATGVFTDSPASGGTYWYGMHVVDNAGNVGFETSAQKKQVTVNQITKPTLDSPSDNVIITSASTTFNWSHLYTTDLYELKIKNQSGDFVYVSGKTSSKSKTVDFSSIPLTYGSTYKWYVVVYANGLEDSSSDRYFTYKSDSKVPTVGSFTIDTTSVKLGEKFTFNYSVSDSGGSNLQKVELWRSTDGDHFSPVSGKVNSHSGTSATGVFTDSPASGGTYWYGMHVIDNADNVGFETSAQKKQVTVNQITKPTLDSPSDNVNITSTSTTFNWSHKYTTDQYELKIKNQSGEFVYTSGKISSQSKTVDLSGIPLIYGSTYKWYVVVYANGLEDSSVDRYFTYKSDSIVPIVGNFTIDTTSLKLGDKFTFNYSVSDSGGSNLQKAELWRSTDGDNFSPVSGKVNSHSGTSATGVFTDSPASAGTYWYGMHVIDNAGNVGFETTTQKKQVSVIGVTSGRVDVSEGVTVTPSPVTLGQNFTVSFRLKEFLGSSKALEYVEIWIQNNSGSDLYMVKRWDSVFFYANQEKTFSATTYLDPAHGRGVGNYQARVRAKVAGETPFNFGVVSGSGGVNPTSFSAGYCTLSGIVSGQVIDANSNQAKTGITVNLGAKSTISANDGSFSFPGVAAGQRTLAVSVPGYANGGVSVNVCGNVTQNILLTRNETTYGAKAPSGYSADPVNTATGNYTFNRTDLKLPGKGIGFAFERGYNSLDPLNGPLGYGWTHNYHTGLAVDGSGNVTVRYGDGHTVTFAPNGSGGYTPQYGVFDTLVKESDASYTLTQKDQSVYRFGTDLRLLSIADRNGNTITLSYSGALLTRVTDAAGRPVDFSYDSSGRIIQISDPLSRSVQISYDVAGNLVTSTDTAGKVTRYGYDANHQLISATDPLGNVFVTNT
jgi:YD repeat-containing protein